MARFLLVRVCETIANLEGKISNYTSLSDNGIQQAERVKDRLRSCDIHSIYSSNMDSAFASAKIIAKAFAKISVIKYVEFDETDLGGWDGMKKIDIEMQNKSEWEEWLYNLSENWRFPGAKETLKDVQIRAMKKLKAIALLHKVSDIVCVVTHGNIIRVILCSLLNISLSNILKFDQFNGAITALEYDGNKVRIQCINDYSHLHSQKFPESITGKPWFIC